MRIGFAWLCSSAGLYATDSLKSEFLDNHVLKNAGGSRSAYATPSVQVGSVGALDREEFDATVRRGIPTVFRDVAFDWEELRNLSCHDFGQRWPDARMRAEYTGVAEEVLVQLGDEESWASNFRPVQGVHAPAEDSEEDKNSRPSVGPYVLHVKDRVKRKMKEELSRIFPGLPFARSPDSSLIDAQSRDSIEFWFQPIGGGTFAHNDGYCHSVFSVQLRGRKKWSFMLTPEVEVLARDVFDEFDSGIYESVHKWAPDFELVLEEGDGVLFPPGYMHETRTLDGPSSEDVCGTSVTFNLPIPMPARLVRRFLNRFSTSREISHCMPRWESFVTLNATLVDWTEDWPNSTLPAKIARNIFHAVDIDRDERVSLAELEDFFANTSNPQVHAFSDGRDMRFGDLFLMFSPYFALSPGMLREGLRRRAKDTLDMWDVNEDGIASFEEVVDVVGFFQYHAIKAGIVDSVLHAEHPETGEPVDIVIGSDLFKSRLAHVDEFLKKVVPDVPVLDPRRYEKVNCGRGDDEL